MDNKKKVPGVCIDRQRGVGGGCWVQGVVTLNEEATVVVAVAVVPTFNHSSGHYITGVKNIVKLS